MPSSSTRPAPAALSPPRAEGDDSDSSGSVSVSPPSPTWVRDRRQLVLNYLSKHPPAESRPPTKPRRQSAEVHAKRKASPKKEKPSPAPRKKRGRPPKETTATEDGVSDDPSTSRPTKRGRRRTREITGAAAASSADSPSPFNFFHPQQAGRITCQNFLDDDASVDGDGGDKRGDPSHHGKKRRRRGGVVAAAPSSPVAPAFPPPPETKRGAYYAVRTGRAVTRGCVFLSWDDAAPHVESLHWTDPPAEYDGFDTMEEAFAYARVANVRAEEAKERERIEKAKERERIEKEQEAEEAEKRKRVKRKGYKVSKAFQVSLERMKEYQETHGHHRVTHREDRNLCRWIYEQRERYKVRVEQEKKLESAVFSCVDGEEEGEDGNDQGDGEDEDGDGESAGKKPKHADSVIPLTDEKEDGDGDSAGKKPVLPLTDEKVDLLTEAGFDFLHPVEQQFSWDEQLEHLRRYREEERPRQHDDVCDGAGDEGLSKGDVAKGDDGNGNTKHRGGPPLDHPVLGAWWKSQCRDLDLRMMGKPMVTLTEEQVSQLAALGIEVETKAEAEERVWEGHFSDLVEYKNNNGHCLVPLRTKAPFASLSLWVRRQRAMYTGKHCNSGLLTKDRIRRLNDVGFVFRAATVKLPWESRLDQLRQYREEHGDLLVKERTHPDLGSFVSNQRTYYRQYTLGEKSCLNEERIAQLNDLGMVWLIGKERGALAKPMRSWEERFEDLVEWHMQYGHCLVPQMHPSGLGHWVKSQRIMYRSMKTGKKLSRGGQLTPEKVTRLVDLGFCFDATYRRGSKISKDDYRKEGGKESKQDRAS